MNIVPLSETILREQRRRVLHMVASQVFEGGFRGSQDESEDTTSTEVKYRCRNVETSSFRETYTAMWSAQFQSKNLR